MFKCQSCRQQSAPGQGQVRKVVEVRKKVYENVVKRGKHTKTIRSEGFETVREVGICAPCASK